MTNQISALLKFSQLQMAAEALFEFNPKLPTGKKIGVRSQLIPVYLYAPSAHHPNDCCEVRYEIKIKEQRATHHGAGEQVASIG